MTSEQMTVATASNLPHKIKKSERNERAAGDHWKKFADPVVNRHAAPNDQHAQRNCEEHVTRAGHAGNRERFRFFPVLCPGRDDKRQPVCRDGSVQEGDGKSTDCNCCKNDGVHRSDITTSAWLAWFFALQNRTTPVTKPA
jgi:hypothetical protein